MPTTRLNSSMTPKHRILVDDIKMALALIKYGKQRGVAYSAPVMNHRGWEVLL
jgi:hypothetical protein